MYEKILEKNLAFIQEQKLYHPLDTQVIELVEILNSQKIVTLSWLRHSGKTKLIHALLKKTQSFRECFYYNSDIDSLWVIKSEKDLIILLDMYVRIYGVPKIIVLQNSNNIVGIKAFIAQLYKTKKYKLIIAGNNIKIEWVRDMELFPLWIDSEKLSERVYGGISEVRIIPDLKYKDFLLHTLKHDIVSRDILEAYTIKNISLFYQVITFLAHITGYHSLREIHRMLEEHSISISLLTMIDYISAALNTKLLSRCYLYDMKQQAPISSQVQYFFGDVGIRRSFDIESSLDENILYLECKRRWYEVFWGQSGRFLFSLRAIKNDTEYCIHLETSLDKDVVRKSARKLAKMGGMSIKLLVVEDKNKLPMRKFEEAGVKIVDMAEWITLIA